MFEAAQNSGSAHYRTFLREARGKSTRGTRQAKGRSAPTLLPRSHVAKLGSKGGWEMELSGGLRGTERCS